MKFFRRRAVIVFIGLVLLALLIWYGGPYLAFAEFKPFEPELNRYVGIGALVVWWLLSLLFKKWRASRAGAKLAQAMVAQRAPPTRDGATREAEQLRERFDEAMATLKKTQRNGRNLYELPWYVIIGPPGSGKTTALVNSGLKFPLEQRFGKEALRGVGGTRNCDWWFTDEAVLLDTAGRYTTQDSDESADSAGWAEFLKLLTQYRKRRPLNGVIVTLSAAELMTHTPAEREGNVAAVRRRLDELNRHLKVRLPVYVLVTKCDLISGFNEYFDDLSAAGRTQVWGTTFAAERSSSGNAADDFLPEFDALIERLNQRLFARIEEERDTRRRTAAFAFPQQVAGLRALIAAFVSEVFSATRFDGRLLLRGVYFTSGTQEGTPIDRLMAAIGRGFAMTNDAVSSGMSGRGKAYFIEQLLRDVMFAEAGIAGVNRGRELRLAALQMSAYAASLLLAALGVAALSISYSRNRDYLADVTKSLDEMTAKLGSRPLRTAADIAPGLDALHDVVESANRFRGHLAWTLRWGLFQGGAVGDGARGAYARELNGTFLPNIADELKQRLQTAAAQPNVLYQYLKAYLMLGQPQHLDKEQLTYLVDYDWRETYADQPDLLQSLDTHLHNLLNEHGVLRPLPLDDGLVTQTRNTVRQASLPRLMYNQLKLNHVDDTSHDLLLNLQAGLGAERVLSRRSGKKLSEPIPGLYTRAVFEQISGKGTTALLMKQFAQDSWVMGDSAFDVQGSERMTQQVMDLYVDDYVKTWDVVLSDIQVVPLKTLAQTSEVLGLLGGPTSPLKGFLATVAANTNLAKPAEADPANPGLVANAEKAVLAPLSKILGNNKAAASGPSAADKITAHFAPINNLVAGPPGAAPIDQVTAQMAKIHDKISTLGTGVGETSAMDDLAKNGQSDQIKQLQLQASTLPAPIGAMVAEIGGRSGSLTTTQARSELEQRYQDQVVNKCRDVAAGRYPFTAGSGVDVPLADFGRLLGAGGIFDAFFKENLAPLVDTSRTPWVWRAGGSAPGGTSNTMLRQFEAVQHLRERYFAPNAQLPEQQFTMTPGELDVGATRFILEVDGQQLDYRHGPVRSMPAKWPGPAPGAATATFEDRSGARANVAFQGPWAWFRLLDAAQLRADTEVRINATFQAGGHQGVVLIEPTSLRNAFQNSGIHQFRCGG